MKNLNKIISSVCVLGALTLSACSDDDKVADFAVFQPAENLVVCDASVTPSSLLVIPDTNVVVGIKGLQVQDVLLIRSQETGEYADLSWGMFCSEDDVDEDGNYIFSTDKIITTLKENGAWTVGKMDLVLHRGLLEQVVTTFDVNAVEVNSDIIDTDLAYNGIIGNIYGKGWQAPEIDSMVVVNKATGAKFVLPTPGNSDKGIGDKLQFSFQNVKFDMESGDYSLYLRRWNYNFMQKLCDFNYFRYSILSTGTVTADTDGKYRIVVSMDDVREGDYFKVVTGTGKNAYFKQNLSADNFDADKKAYTIVVPDGKVQEYNYNVHYYRGTVDVNMGSIPVKP